MEPIEIKKHISVYSTYFHAVSLSEDRNLFEIDDQAGLKSVDVQFAANYETNDLIKEIIKPLQEASILKVDGKNLMIPLNGLLVLPQNEQTNPAPLVLIGHGNKTAYFDKANTEPGPNSKGRFDYNGKLREHEVPSYAGYLELQNHLAKNGMASYSINLNIVNELLNKEETAFKLLALDFNQRILLFFLHLIMLKVIAGETLAIPKDKYPLKFESEGEFRNLNESLVLSATSVNPALQKLKLLSEHLAGKIDFTKLGFMGHSRGADAVSRISSYFYKGVTSPGLTFTMNRKIDSRIKELVEFLGKPSQDLIKCVLALQPTSVINDEDRSKHGYVIDNDKTMFFAIAGTHDRDVRLDSIIIYEYPTCPKAMIVIKGATHERFNCVWRGNCKIDGNGEEKVEIKKDTPAPQRFLLNPQHDAISRSVLGSCFIASFFPDKASHFLYFIHKNRFPIEIDFQGAWKFGFPFQTNPKVRKDLDEKITGLSQRLITGDGNDYKFEQEIKAFFIKKNNEGSALIELPINVDTEENVAKYTHFSFRFAKGFDISGEDQPVEKNFTIQFFQNDSPVGKLISGKDIKSIILKGTQAFDKKNVSENNKSEPVFETSIILQTAEIELLEFIERESDLSKINRIEVRVIPDKTKVPPPSFLKLAALTAAGAVLVAGLVAGLIYLGVKRKILDKESKNFKRNSIGATLLGAGIGAGSSFLIFRADKDAFVFKDFLLTNRQIPELTNG